MYSNLWNRMSTCVCCCLSTTFPGVPLCDSIIQASCPALCTKKTTAGWQTPPINMVDADSALCLILPKPTGGAQGTHIGPGRGV